MAIQTRETELAKVSRAAKRVLDAGDTKAYVAVMQARQVAGELIDRKLAERILISCVAGLSRKLNESVRQIVNIVAEGESRKRKGEVARAVERIIDAALSEFKSNAKFPNIGIGRSASAARIAEATDRAEGDYFDSLDE